MSKATFALGSASYTGPTANVPVICTEWDLHGYSRGLFIVNVTATTENSAVGIVPMELTTGLPCIRLANGSISPTDGGLVSSQSGGDPIGVNGTTVNLLSIAYKVIFLPASDGDTITFSASLVVSD